MSFANNTTPMQQQEGSNTNAAAIAIPRDEVFLACPNVTMALTRHEVDRALAIKQATEASGLDNLTDFMYVQYAIATHEESMGQVLERIAMMQAFKEEYHIQDHNMVEQGLHFLNEYTSRHPGILLALEYLPSGRNYMTTEDFTEFIPSKVIRTEQDDRLFFGHMYYKFLCQSTQFEAIRNGNTCLLECMGLSLENVDIPFFGKISNAFYRWYPFVQKEQFFVNTPRSVVYIFGLLKQFMTKHQTERMHIDHQIPGLEGLRIDGLYKTPTPEAARLHLMSRVQECLQLRYTNEQEFRLPLLS